MSALSLSLMSIRFELRDRQESALQIVKCGSQESKGAFFSCNHDRLAKVVFGTLVFYNGDVGAHIDGLCAGRRWAMCWVLFFSVAQMDLCSPKPALPPSPRRVPSDQGWRQQEGTVFTAYAGQGYACFGGGEEHVGVWPPKWAERVRI